MATTIPTRTPPPKIVPKLTSAPMRDCEETPIDVTTIVKIMIPVASLNDASTSIRVESFRGSRALRKISRTVAVSVGAIREEKTKAETSGSSAICQSRSPPTTVAIPTPTVASLRAGVKTARNSSYRIFIIVSKRRGGKTSPTKSPPPIRLPYNRLTLSIEERDEPAIATPKNQNDGIGSSGPTGDYGCREGDCEKGSDNELERCHGRHTGMIEILSLLAGLHMTSSSLISILRPTADQIVLGKMR